MFITCSVCGFKTDKADPMELQLRVIKAHMEQWHKPFKTNPKVKFRGVKEWMILKKD